MSKDEVSTSAIQGSTLPRGEQLPKALLLPPPRRSLVFLAGKCCPLTGLALSLEKHAYHASMGIRQWEWSCQKRRDTVGRRPGPAFSLCAFPRSPHPVWRQPQQFNLLHKLYETVWPQVICPTLGCFSQLTGWRPSRKASPGWGQTTWPSYTLLLTWGIHGLVAKRRRV